MTITLQARPATRATSCPLCRDELHAAELREGACGHCPECETRYHRECFAEFGGCSTLGCSAYRQPLRGATPHSANQACAACWDGGESGRLSPCSACGALVHRHCLDQEGCGTRGCDFEQGPRPRRRKARARRRPRPARPPAAATAAPRRTPLPPRRSSKGSKGALSVIFASTACVVCLIYSLTSGNFKAIWIAIWLGMQILSDD